MHHNLIEMQIWSMFYWTVIGAKIENTYLFFHFIFHLICLFFHFLFVVQLHLKFFKN